MNAAKIAKIVAVIVAIVAAFVSFPYAAALLALLGLAVGFLAIPEERRIIFLVSAIALATAAGSLGEIPAVGMYLTAILGNISAVYSAGAVAVILTIIKERVTV